MSLRDKSFYDEEYEGKERSPNDIATEEGTYPNRIRRELRQLGYHLRNRSEAQSAALRHGRRKHPTEGTTLPPEVKMKISQTLKRSRYGTQEEREA